MLLLSSGCVQASQADPEVLCWKQTSLPSSPGGSPLILAHCIHNRKMTGSEEKKPAHLERLFFHKKTHCTKCISGKDIFCFKRRQGKEKGNSRVPFFPVLSDKPWRTTQTKYGWKRQRMGQLEGEHTFSIFWEQNGKENCEYCEKNRCQNITRKIFSMNEIVI